ncbi:MAG: hypothetical protein QM758_13095 [Armatimonas sp.]
MQRRAKPWKRDAILQERKDAMRATPPGFGSRKADPVLSTLSQARAKQLTGRYALCTKLEPSGKLLAVSSAFETIEAVNAALEATADSSLVIALCYRWARRWMPVKYNYALSTLADSV